MEVIITVSSKFIESEYSLHCKCPPNFYERSEYIKETYGMCWGEDIDIKLWTIQSLLYSN
jgi:hypothetical protein